MYISMLLFFCISLYLGLLRYNKINIGLKLDGIIIFLIVLFFHSISLPISRIFFNTDHTSSDLIFGIAMGLAWLGIIISSLLFKKEQTFTFSEINIANINSKYLYILLTGIGYWNIHTIFANLDFNFYNLFQPYGFEKEIKEENKSLLESIREISYFSIVAFCTIIGNKTKNRKLEYFGILNCILYSGLILIRGSRNAALMMAFPLIIYYWGNKKNSILKIISISLFVFLAGYLIGVIRNFGFSEISGLEIEANMFDPLRQEFGTSFSVFSKWYEFQDKFDFKLGRSYILDPIFNFIPYALWPDRPPSVALSFSMDYYGVSKVEDLYAGLGFCPLMEAIYNFGYIGIIPIFSIFYFLFLKFQTFLKRKNTIFASVLNGFFPVFLLNFNRIDFAICLKIYILFIIVSFIHIRILKINR